MRCQCRCSCGFLFVLLLIWCQRFYSHNIYICFITVLFSYLVPVTHNRFVFYSIQCSDFRKGKPGNSSFHSSQVIAYYFYICLVLIKNIYNTFNCLIPFYKRIEPGKSCQVARKGKFAVRSERWNLREDEDKEPLFHIAFAFLSMTKCTTRH